MRRFVAVDDCGNIINPMIVQGQIHGGLTQGLGPALYEEMTYDEDGNNQAGRSWTTWCRPRWRRRRGDGAHNHTVAASSAGGEGGGGIGYGGGAAGDRECGGGRAGAPGRDAHGDPDAAGSGVGDSAGEGGGGVRGVNIQAIRSRLAPRGRFALGCAENAENVGLHRRVQIRRITSQPRREDSSFCCLPSRRRPALPTKHTSICLDGLESRPTSMNRSVESVGGAWRRCRQG